MAMNEGIRHFQTHPNWTIDARSTEQWLGGRMETLLDHWIIKQ